MLHASLSHHPRWLQSAGNLRRVALIALAAFGIGISGKVHAIHLPGNQQLSLALCDPAAASNPYPHYFHINIFRSGSFEIRMNGAVQTGSFYDTPRPVSASTTRTTGSTVSTAASRRGWIWTSRSTHSAISPD